MRKQTQERMRSGEQGMPEASFSMIRAGREMWLQGLVHGRSGNLSLSMGRDMLITASGVCKGRLQHRDILQVERHSGLARSQGKVSTEAGMHLAVYAAQPEAAAIVHSHPTSLLALEQAGVVSIDVQVYEAEVVRKSLGQVAGLPPGSTELARAVAERAKNSQAIFLSRHGLVCWGGDLEQALNLSEEVEALARLQLKAAQLQSSYTKHV